MGITALKCYTVHNLNIVLLYIWCIYYACKNSILIWFNIVHILSLISCIPLLTDSLEQQPVSCDSTVCSICYDVCIYYLMFVYRLIIIIVCVCSHNYLFVCLVMVHGWIPILFVKGVSFSDFSEDYPEY